jgi:ABC-2 type transport system ATP-binding protein
MVVNVENLSKRYPVAMKSPGLKGTMAHFFRRQYQYIDAVKDVSFKLNPSEVVGFLGANGAGKTTTLKMLTGLIYPTGGKVTVAGCDPFRRQPEFLQKITLIMGQKQQLIWDLPALDSLRINAAVYGIDDRESQRRISQLSSMLGLDRQLTQPVRKLSLGERMKAELLAALLHQPEVLFLDEPTLGLDVNAQTSVREFLRAYNQEFGATIVLTSHYMADITALCQRVLLIHGGGLIYDGLLDGLLDRFAPYREVRLELSKAVSTADLAGYGEVTSCEGREVRLSVDRTALTQTISRLLADLPVTDLSVSDPPVEEVIGKVFRDGVAFA